MNSYIFVNGVKVYKFKAKDSQMNVVVLSLGNISKDFLADNMSKAGLFGYYYDFLVDCYCINAADILDIFKYLIIKNNMK